MEKKVLSVVNELIETSRDGEKGFTKSAEEVKEPQLKTLFLTRARSCGTAARELAEKLRVYGGKPEEGGSVTGALHRGWVNAKAAVTGHDTASILAETERGEDYAKKVYGEALEADLPADLREVIERQYQGVLQNHDQVRDLRDSYRSKN
ncbi:MAG: PA2169 family four-helix-bundle protein [Pseudomonadota bacterium]